MYKERFRFLRALQQQKRRPAEKVERESGLAAMPEVSVRIFDHARRHGRVTMGEIIRV
ncbi:MAG: hypothetical protein IPO77_07975 [Acidobacteria bacterium]|nr:hypothetical protein [Acidobacteriota bacterium]